MTVGGVESTSLEVLGVGVSLQRKGRGAPLLMLHGEDTASRWLPFHDSLAERFQVILPDHPGFGRSAQPDWLDTIQDLAYSYLELVTALGLECVRVVGESFGGWLAAALAIAQPERIERLALVGPLGFKPPGLILPDLFAMSPEEWSAMTLEDETLAAREAEGLRVRENLERHLRDRATLARLAWTPHLHDPKLPVWLHRIRLPTLLVWGRQDRVVPPAVADAWLERLPDARLVVIEQAGHLPHLERPAEAARIVGDFLAEGG